MKRYIICFILVIISCVACSPIAMASEVTTQSSTVGTDNTFLENKSEPIYSIKTNEYDMYVNLQSTPASTLLNSGYSEDEVARIKSTTMEDLLYQRAQLTNDDLQMMGYSQEEIVLLQSYNKEPLSENPNFKRLVAEFEGYLRLISANTNRIGASFEFRWSKTPLTTGLAMDEIIACGFGGTKNDNGIAQVKLVESESHLRVFYYDGNQELGEFVGAVDYDLVVRDVYHDVKVTFPLLHNISGQGCWAARGEIMVIVEEEVTVNTLYSVAFAFGYGHNTLIIDPEISVTISGWTPSLLFRLGTEETFYKTIVINHEGQYEIYNGEMD